FRRASASAASPLASTWHSPFSAGRHRSWLPASFGARDSRLPRRSSWSRAGSSRSSGASGFHATVAMSSRERGGERSGHGTQDERSRPTAPAETPHLAPPLESVTTSSPKWSSEERPTWKQRKRYDAPHGPTHE